MTETSSEKIESLVAHYQKTNKLLRTRAILLSVLFLLILGFQHTLQENDEKRIGLFRTINTLNEIVEANDLKAAFDSLKFSIVSDYYVIDHNIISEEKTAKLEYDLSKSNFTDKTPVYDLISEYDKEIKELGVSPEDYSINILGTNTSFSNWVYFAPIILLLLYHDMTVMFLYRKSLRAKLEAAGVECWRFGSEIFGTEPGQEETPTHRFIRLITTVIIVVLLFLPLIPAFTSALMYIANTSQGDIQPILIFFQWISPVVMTIELIIIYHTENFLKIKSIIIWIGEWFSIPPSKATIMLNLLYAIFIVIVFIMIGCSFQERKNIDIQLTLTVLLTIIPLPLSSWLLFRSPTSRIFKGLRIIARIMLAWWILNLILFAIKDGPYYPNDFWINGGLIIFGISIMIAAIYIWVYSGKKKQNFKN